MPFPLPSLEEIRTAILTDWRNADNLVAVDADSDNYIRASGVASAILGLYQFAGWGINQFFPDTADIENLVRFASARGITQHPATNAAGTVRISGTVAAAVPLATIIQTADGRQYKTTAPGAIGAGGTVVLAAAAINVGPDANLPDNTPGTLLSAPAGVDAAALLLQMGGGLPAESQASLLARVLDRLRQPPAGGNKYDYPRWALEVPGVTSAFMYPTRRGLGTADVAILCNGLPPSEAMRGYVAAYISFLAPVGADVMVLSPQLVTVDITATLVLSETAEASVVSDKAIAALTAYFASLRPGDIVRRTRIQTILGDIDGVIDYDLTAPAANVDILVDASHVQMAALGAVDLGF